ncbi:MAG: hypothetical protein IPM18_12690 [Phycisphaerales bacterium]|nr:hypothetical protein [Phycisphaerales bacterium]
MRIDPVRYSQDGFAALRAGNCDLACTDRPLGGREMADFGAHPPVGRRLAFYGYGLYVHPANPTDAMYTGHLRAILRGQFNDWKQVAGAAGADYVGPIRVYGTAKSTRAGELLSRLAGIVVAEATWQVCANDEAVLAAVAGDPLGLGLAGLGYDGDDVRYLGLRMTRDGTAVLPSIEAIEEERYGLARMIYIYHAAPPTEAVRAAMEYLASPAGAAAIIATDLWPIAPERRDLPMARPGEPHQAGQEDAAP